MITIHWDFVDGTEISYAEGKEKGDNFTTNCLDFFRIDRDVIVVKKNCEWISSIELRSNSKYHTAKFIRNVHNIHKMLVAGAFTWAQPLKDKPDCVAYCSSCGHITHFEHKDVESPASDFHCILCESCKELIHLVGSIPEFVPKNTTKTETQEPTIHVPLKRIPVTLTYDITTYDPPKHYKKDITLPALPDNGTVLSHIKNPGMNEDDGVFIYYIKMDNTTIYAHCGDYDDENIEMIRRVEDDLFKDGWILK
jgi:hypothetical protein